MSEENEHYEPSELDQVDQELGIVEAVGVHDELVSAVESGLNKTWSFETLAIQAELEKQEEVDVDRLWIEGTLKSSYYDVPQEPEEILAGINLSAESFQSKARELLEAVLAFLGRIVKSAIAILKDCTEFLIGIEAKAKRVRYWAENSRHKKIPSGAVLKLGKTANKLLVGMGCIKNGQELQVQLTEHLEVLKTLREYASGNLQLGSSLAGEIKGFSFDQPEASLDRISKIYERVHQPIAAKLCTKETRDTRYFVNKGGRLLGSKPLLGGKSFFLVQNSQGSEQREILRNLIRSGLVYSYSSISRPTLTDASFAPMNADEIIKSMDLVLKLSAEAKALAGEEIQRKTEQMNQRLSEASKQLLKYFDQQDRQTVRAPVELAVDAIKAFSVQSTTPVLNYLSTLNSTLRAVNTLGKGSLAALR